MAGPQEEGPFPFEDMERVDPKVMIGWPAHKEPQALEGRARIEGNELHEGGVPPFPPWERVKKGLVGRTADTGPPGDQETVVLPVFGALKGV